MQAIGFPGRLQAPRRSPLAAGSRTPPTPCLQGGRIRWTGAGERDPQPRRQGGVASMGELRQNRKMLKYSMDIFCRRKCASNSPQSIAVKG